MGVMLELLKPRWVAMLLLCACSAQETQPGQDGPGPNAPNAPNGPNMPQNEHWSALCAGCHGTYEGSSAISTGNANGDFRLDAESAVLRHGEALETYIEETMPFQAAASCQGECAQVTGAYIRSRYRPVTPQACEGQETTYGVRELKLLTSLEYQRSLEDLLGVQVNHGTLVENNNGARGGFISMRGKSVSDSTLESYVRNAEAIATWAVGSGRPFQCTGADCGRRFVDEFLFKAFRGQVSQAQREAYIELFQTYPNEGMQLALEAALTSPYFLYRIEAGVDLQTAIDSGFYTNTDDTPPPGPSGDVVETIMAGEFPQGSGRLEGDVWAFTENGAVELSFETAFTDPTTLVIEARGSDFNNAWPELTLRVGGQQIAVQRVDHRDLRNYSFVVDGQSGSPRVRIEFNNDAGMPPWGPGQDINLYIASVGIAPAAAEPPPPPPPTMGGEDVLAGVDPDAYVLTPYELASALSFMLTGSTPDPQLLQAAQDDRLTTRAQLQAQVTRLIDSARGREHFEHFVAQWFELNEVKSASRPDIPEFTAEVKAAMVREVQAHFAHVFYDEEAPFSEFYGGDYTFLNRTLAQFYGVQGNFDDQFVKTEVQGRGGPIASGAFMAANAHVERTAPILRAVHAREAALCHHIDPPNSPLAGDDIDEQRAAAQMRVAEREQEGALSSRDFYFLYTDGIDACAGCHERIINPMFGMEDFDNVGRLRPTAGASAVIETVHGEDMEVSLEGTLFGVASTSDQEIINYVGAKDLSNQIAQTDAVKACLVRRGFRYITGLPLLDRDLDTAVQEQITEAQRLAYGCIASRMTEALTQNGESPRAMFIELATESLMRLRRGS